MKKIRAYNAKALADTFSHTAQIESTITEILAGIDPKSGELPTSKIPTKLLYEIVICYNIMYNMLQEAHLMADGHVKPSATIH